MWPEFDKNAAYIWACYGLGAILILGAALQVVLTARKARARLDETGAPNPEDGAP